MPTPAPEPRPQAPRPDCATPRRRPVSSAAGLDTSPGPPGRATGRPWSSAYSDPTEATERWSTRGKCRVVTLALPPRCQHNAQRTTDRKLAVKISQPSNALRHSAYPSKLGDSVENSVAEYDHMARRSEVRSANGSAGHRAESHRRPKTEWSCHEHGRRACSATGSVRPTEVGLSRAA